MKMHPQKMIDQYETCFTASHDELSCYLAEDVASQTPAVDETAHSELLQELDKVQTEYSDLADRHDAQIRDNSQLSR